MITIHWSILLYFTIQCSMFGLIIGLAAEEADSIKKAAFIWLLSIFWPLIIAYRFLVMRKAKP